MSFFLSSPPAASQSASSSTSLLPPSKEQLMALRAMPSTMLALGSSKAYRPSSRAKKRGARDNKARVFNPQAGRPQSGIPNPGGQVITVVDEYVASLFSTSVSVPVYSAAAISLSLFPNVAEYTALFDQYKIIELEAWIEPNIPVVTTGTIGSVQFATAVDLDDATVPGSASVVLGKQECLTSETGTSHYHKWKPHMAVALYSGAFTSYGNVLSGWIDCASPAVQHFGLKSAVTGADGVARQYSLTVRAHLQFRSAGI